MTVKLFRFSRRRRQFMEAFESRAALAYVRYKGRSYLVGSCRRVKWFPWSTFGLLREYPRTR